LSVLLSVRGR